MSASDFSQMNESGTTENKPFRLLSDQSEKAFFMRQNERRGIIRWVQKLCTITEPLKRSGVRDGKRIRLIRKWMKPEKRRRNTTVSICSRIRQGNGLHVGHWRGYVISDVWSRYKLQQGYYIIHPMGWDAFGLPAENYAIKMGVHPAKSTAENVANIKKQINDIAALYDWDMEVNTTDPDFYKWTQWIFVKMFKAGLAYEKEFPINWCPSCKTGLANEEVVNGKCERCGAEVTKKNLRQWMLRITKYADRPVK